MSNENVTINAHRYITCAAEYVRSKFARVNFGSHNSALGRKPRRRASCTPTARGCTGASYFCMTWVPSSAGTQPPMSIQPHTHIRLHKIPEECRIATGHPFQQTYGTKTNHEHSCSRTLVRALASYRKRAATCFLSSSTTRVAAKS
jgi:hypothetical protein